MMDRPSLWQAEVSAYGWTEPADPYDGSPAEPLFDPIPIVLWGPHLRQGRLDWLFPEETDQLALPRWTLPPGFIGWFSFMRYVLTDLDQCLALLTACSVDHGDSPPFNPPIRFGSPLGGSLGLTVPNTPAFYID